MGHYLTAQICLNGHLITDSADAYPAHQQKFCSECGLKTIMNCQECNVKILGDYHVDGFFGSSNYQIPSYCHNCGNPYPWTEDKLSTTQELLELDNVLSREEINYLSANLNSLLVDTPKTKLVATKLKLALAKVSTVAATAIKDIVVDISSEAAKKIIMGE